jgi:hypothetical protein
MAGELGVHWGLFDEEFLCPPDYFGMVVSEKDRPVAAGEVGDRDLLTLVTSLIEGVSPRSYVFDGKSGAVEDLAQIRLGKFGYRCCPAGVCHGHRVRERSKRVVTEGSYALHGAELRGGYPTVGDRTNGRGYVEGRRLPSARAALPVPRVTFSERVA